MDFGEILHKAQKNEQNKNASGSFYRAKFDPPKKEQKQRTLSANIQKFLQKKEEEEKMKEEDTRRKRDELLALRDPKATKKIQKMLKVIKSANKSVLAEAVDHEHTAVTRGGPLQPDEDDYGYESQAAAAIFNQMMERFSKMPEEEKFPSSAKRAAGDISGTKERVRAALIRQQEEEAGPHRRKRKPKDPLLSPTYDEREREYDRDDEQERRNEKPKPKRPPAPVLSFSELLRIAEQKKNEPVDILEAVKKPAAVASEPERPMTKRQRREYEEEKARREAKERRDMESKLGKKKQPIRSDSSDRTPATNNRIPKLSSKSSDERFSKPERQITGNESNNRFSIPKKRTDDDPRERYNRQMDSDNSRSRNERLDNKHIEQRRPMDRNNREDSKYDDRQQVDRTFYKNPENKMNDRNNRDNERDYRNSDPKMRARNDFDQKPRHDVKNSPSSSGNSYSGNTFKIPTKSASAGDKSRTPSSSGSSSRPIEKERMQSSGQSLTNHSKTDINHKSAVSRPSLESASIKRDLSEAKKPYSSNGHAKPKSNMEQRSEKELSRLKAINDRKTEMERHSNQASKVRDAKSLEAHKDRPPAKPSNRPTNADNRAVPNSRPVSLQSGQQRPLSKDGERRAVDGNRPAAKLPPQRNGQTINPAGSAVKKQIPPAGMRPKSSNIADAKARPFPPADVKPRQFPPADTRPKQFPPADMKPRQFPPADLKTRQFPPSDVRKFPPDDVRKKMAQKQAQKRRVIDSEDEIDSELEDFIDDGPEENQDYSKYIKEIFGYDKNKYRGVDDDDINMESSYAQQMREEFISKKIGLEEDLEDMKMEAMEKKRKATLKKRRIDDDD